MLTAFLGAALLGALALPPVADEPSSLLQLLPDEGCVLRASAPSGRVLLEALANGPLGGLPLPEDARDGLDDLRKGLGRDLLPAASALLDGEIAAGIFAVGRSRLDEDGGRKRAALIAAQPRDPEAAQDVLRQALQLAALAGAEITEGAYRDVSYTRVAGDLVVSSTHGVLLLSGDDDLLADAIDRLLAATPRDAFARDDPALRDELPARVTFEFHPALLRERDVRKLGRAPRRLGGPAATPGASLLLGPLLAALDADGVVNGTVDVDGHGLRLLADAPRDDALPRAYAPPQDGTTLVPTTEMTLGVLFARRDLADWWRHREELLDEDSQQKLAKFDGTMSLFFSGASLSEDVFAQLDEDIAVVFDVLDFADTDDVPALRLPSACLVVGVRDERHFKPRLEVAFQTLLGVVNTERAKDGRPAFLLEVTLHEGVPIRYGRLLSGEMAGMREGDPLPSDYNLRPALAVCEGRLLLGTSVEQVRGLVTALRAAHGRQHDANLELFLDAALLRRLAEDDHDVLVAQAMLDDGLDPRAAVAQVDGLLALLQLFGTARLRTSLAGPRTTLELRVDFADAAR